MPENDLYLNEARDEWALIFDSTAQLYEEYLDGEYKGNFNSRKDQWKAHYERMQDSFRDCIWSVVEKKGIPRKDLNVGVVGPGLHPIGCDFDRSIMRDIFDRVNKVVIIDFSQKVVRSAMDELIEGGIPHHKVLGMQFDVSKALSTVYHQFLEEKLEGITTEEELSRLTEELEKVEMQEFEERRSIAIEKASEIVRKSEPLIDGGKNELRSLELTLGPDKIPLPLHVVSYQMVLAGTGASAEDLFWNRFKEVTSDQNRGAKQESVETMREREAMHGRIYKLIARFNTHIATLALREMLQANPQASALSVMDVSTNYYDEPRASFPRLQPHELEEALANPTNGWPKISSTGSRANWDWKDEPEHFHPVHAYEFTVASDS